MQYVLNVTKALLSIIYICALDLFSLLRGCLLRMGSEFPAVNVTEEQVRHLREKGYLLLEDYYSLEQVDQIMEMAQVHMQEGYGDFDHINGHSYYRCPEESQDSDGGVFRLFSADLLQEEAHAFREDPSIIALLERAFSTRISCNASVLQKNLPVGSETRGFHVDMYAPKQFKAFLFLTDVLAEEQGPYAIIEGSHRWRWRHCVNFLRRGIAGDRDVTSFAELGPADLQNLRLFKVRKGTVVIATQQAIHRGWPLVDGLRFALVNYYIERLPEHTPGYRINNRLGYRYIRDEEQVV